MMYGYSPIWKLAESAVARPLPHSGAGGPSAAAPAAGEPLAEWEQELLAGSEEAAAPAVPAETPAVETPEETPVQTPEETPAVEAPAQTTVAEAAETSAEEVAEAVETEAPAQPQA